MKQQFLFFGRGERSVLITLIVLALSGGFLLWHRGDQAQAQARQSLAEGDTIYTTRDYVGPPEHLRHREGHKLKAGTTLDLNTADSALLTRVPGIGPAFARRIVRLRERLGGYYTTLQLQEVYGMDEDKFLELRPWFRIKTPPKRYSLENLKADDLPNHPYLSYTHKRALRRLISRHGTLHRWSTLMREGSFSRDDSVRLSHYLIESKTDSIDKGAN